MIDASHIKVHPDAAGAKGGNQEMKFTKGGSTPKYIWPWDTYGMPVRMVITSGTTVDCSQIESLIDGFEAEHLLRIGAMIAT